MAEVKGKITPLWIIAAFVTLTETVLGYAVTKTTAGVQVALTVFVILFAILVAIGFFMILWHRPFVFYSPSEYGDVDPTSFIAAVKLSVSPRVQEQVELVRMVEKHPSDKNAQFNLIDSLLEPVTRQHLIIMQDFSVDIPYDDMFGHRYEMGTQNKHYWQGHFAARDFVQKLEGTRFVELVSRGGIKIKLTDDGREFACWLTANGKKEEYVSTPFGAWGKTFILGKEDTRAQTPEPKTIQAEQIFVGDVGIASTEKAII